MGIIMSTALSLTTTSSLEKLTTSEPSPTLAQTRPLFLSLPLEVRLQIYRYVIISNPVKHAQLSPSSTDPSASSASPLRVMSVPIAFQYYESDEEGMSDPKPFALASSAILPPSRRLGGIGCGSIPTALLITCKQVYKEASSLPWEENEYVFINWFFSGVYAARSFMKALKPWQRESMRWAGVEVLRRDLEDTWVAIRVGGRPGAGEWKDLCALWSGNKETGQGGLQGLRLGIKGPITASLVRDANDGSVSDKQNGLMEVGAHWITQGLSQMRALRWLEIEIEDNDISRDAKVDFCLSLGQSLSQLSNRRIDVLLAEQPEKVVVKENERNPDQLEENSIWAVDS